MPQAAHATTTDLDALLSLCRLIASRSPKTLHALLVLAQLAVMSLDT